MLPELQGIFEKRLDNGTWNDCLAHCRIDLQTEFQTVLEACFFDLEVGLQGRQLLIQRSHGSPGLMEKRKKSAKASVVLTTSFG